MSPALEALIWLIIVTVLMLLLKRWIHRHVQGIGLLLTGDSDRSFLLYSLLLFPGTVVHELSHFAAALFLDVRVRKLSLIPTRQPDGPVRLGFVEIDRTETLREALIGLAPLIAGTAFVLLLAPPGLPTLQESRPLAEQLGDLLGSIPNALGAPDFWLLLYLIFSISNGMLPSESDRQAWRPVAIWLGAAALLLYVSGVVTSLPDSIDLGIAAGVRWIVRAFMLSIAVDVGFLPIIFVIEWMLERLTRQRVQY
jgi:hypothetical protein